MSPLPPLCSTTQLTGWEWGSISHPRSEIEKNRMAEDHAVSKAHRELAQRLLRPRASSRGTLADSLALLSYADTGGAALGGTRGHCPVDSEHFTDARLQPLVDARQILIGELY